ncbi:hypothetical protein [Chryseobacterium sp. CT-SW4]|uniref:hypothetical protein n=1 Tax=Chryseobacterium sp. SW-1 TaxID=3157343 RepID=UPI003B02CCB1
MLIIRKSNFLPTLDITFQFEGREDYSQKFYGNKEVTSYSDITLIYKPSLRRYTYLGAPVKKLYLTKADYFTFSDKNVSYKSPGQSEAILIHNYNTETWSTSSFIDLNGLTGGFLVKLETLTDTSKKKIIKISPYH